MSEIALISARKNRLETAAKKGNKSAKTALDLANSPNKFLSTVQIGITLIGILTGIYSGDKITKDVELFIQSYEVFQPYAHSIAVGIVVVVLTFFSLSTRGIVAQKNWSQPPRVYCKDCSDANEIYFDNHGSFYMVTYLFYRCYFRPFANQTYSRWQSN